MAGVVTATTSVTCGVYIVNIHFFASTEHVLAAACQLISFGSSVALSLPVASATIRKMAVLACFFAEDNSFVTGALVVDGGHGSILTCPPKQCLRCAQGGWDAKFPN